MKNNSKLLLLVILVNLPTLSTGLWFPFDVFSNTDTDVNCTSSQFKCDNKHCIKNSWVCDNHVDCMDGEDEKNCTGEKCPRMMYKCDNGRCIDPYFKCDGQDQCGDGSDEINCSDADLRVCDHNSFHCATGKECIPSDFVCDGSEDCYDGSDEHLCDVKQCESDEFLCVDTTLCIYRYQVCDNIPDCVDGSDESDDICNDITRCESMHGSFMCTNMESCLDVRQVCDGHFDCSDKSDEPRNCSIICKELGCEQGCSPIKGVVGCVCMSGFVLDTDNKSCNDVDECRVDQDWQIKCSQICKNEFGSYSCDCISGYALEPDEHVCRAVDGEPQLFYSSSTTITQLGMYSSDSSYFRTDLTDVSAIAVNSDEKTVFWSSKSNKEIYKSRTDYWILHRQRAIISVGLISPIGLAYDWIGENLYILDSGLNKVIVCKPDGISCTIILNNLTSPTSIAVDSHSRMLYLSEAGNKMKISRSWLDGGDQHVFVTENLGIPTSLFIDLTTSRLYWSDITYGIITSINLDGTNRKINLPHEVENPSLLVIFEDTLLWTDHHKHSLMSANKLNGRKVQHLVRNLHRATAAAVLHPSLQTKDNFGSACELHKCSHICLLSNNKVRFTCACPIDYQLMEDQQTCERKGSSKVLLVAHHSDILQFSLDYIGGDPYTTIASDDGGDFLSLGYDPLKKRVVHSTMEFDHPVICQSDFERTHFQTHNHTVIVNENIKKIASLAVDWVARNVFWVDSEKKTLEVSRLDIKARVVLLTSTVLREPRALALNILQGTMFLSDWGGTVRIDKCDMDGTNCYHLVTKRLGKPNYLTIDQDTGRLFWTDARLGEITSVTFDGENRITHTVSTEEPLSLAVIDGMMYWTDWRTDTIQTLNFTNNQHSILHSGMESMTGLTLIYEIKPIDNGCSKNNGDCSHICLAKSNNGHTCKCPDELQLDSDEITCVQDDYDCKAGEIKCRVDSSCLSPQQICDENQDCSDKSDETNCPSKCKDGHFRCSDGKCIPTRWMCDGTSDCVDDTDELQENCVAKVCKKREFRCTQYMCIIKSLVCDHFEDCPNGADEMNCTSKCPPGNFKCDDGWCITEQKNCNGVKDCLDGSDEVECPGSECLVMNGNCSHKCESLDQNFWCSCLPGYELASDKRTCHAKGVRPYLLVANNNGIHSVSTTGQTGQTDLLTSTTTPAVFIDMVMETGAIIWSTYKETSNKSSIHTVTGNKSHIIVEMKGYISGLAVDWITRNVYYSSYTSLVGQIGVCNIDKSDCTTLIQQSDLIPTSIAVHPLKGVMYWFDKQEEILVMSSMDGSNFTTLFDSEIHKPISLAIDYVKDKLFWIDDFFSWIKSVDLTGEKSNTVGSTLFESPQCIDVFENVAYVTDIAGISRVTLYYGETTIMSRIANPKGIKIVHPLKQLTGPNLCETKSCQYLCVLVPDGVHCLCPDGYILNKDLGDCYDKDGIPYKLEIDSVEVKHAIRSDSPHVTNKADVKIDNASISKENSKYPTKYTDLANKTRTKKCSLVCKNGGICQQINAIFKCSCAEGFNGTHCELKINTTSTLTLIPASIAATSDDNESKLWILGIVLGAVLIIVFISGLFYYLRSKNKDVSLVSMIKYRNPNIGQRCEEVEELVPEISFNNPGFQDCDDISHDQASGDWWQSLHPSSRSSVDSAFLSRQSLSNSNSSNGSH